MEETQFLEMSALEQGHFIEELISPDEILIIAMDEYTTTWQGMGKGIEHANENGFDVELSTNINHGDKRGEVLITSLGRDGISKQENIFLAFWIAYLKALGVLE
jgi:hypothetical protein